MINKKFELTTRFTTKAFEDSDDLVIEGIASAATKDRDGDVIITDAWRGKALTNYSNNPIILAYHDPKQPIGKALDYIVDDVGLHITARISKSAGRVYDLIKQGILQTFSVGFNATDIDYDEDEDLFIIKALELFEISVVSIPANAGSTFSVRKALSEEDYKELKSEFVTENKKPAEQVTEVQPQMEKEIMTDKVKETNDKLQKEVSELTAGLSVLLDAQSKREDAAKQATKDAEVQAQKDTKALATKTAEDAVAAAKKEKEDTQLATKAAITVVGTGAEAMIKDLEAKFTAQEATMGDTIKEFKEEIEAKNVELLAMQRSKMNFEDNGSRAEVQQKDADTAVLLGKMLGIKPSQTKFGSALLTKAGAPIGTRTGVGGADGIDLGADGVSTPATPIGEHMSGMDEDWEHSFSSRIWNDIQTRLIMEPLFGNIAMNTASLTLPINPEAKYGEWISRAAFENPAARLGAVDNGSTGAAQKHVLTDITLIAQKLAAKEYIGYEEEEDTILPIVSVIRDAIVHRMARSTDQALILGNSTVAIGANQGAWPFNGLVKLATDVKAVYTSVGTAGTTGASPPAAARANPTPADGNLPAGGTPGSMSSAVRDLIVTRRGLGNWGLNPADIVYIVSSDFYYDLLEDPTFQTMDKVGTHATILSGQVGMISGSPVIVSGEFPAAGSGMPMAIALNKSNFYVGTLRGLLTERDRDIVAQQNVIVSTRRFDFKQIITGQGVSVLVAK